MRHTAVSFVAASAMLLAAAPAGAAVVYVAANGPLDPTGCVRIPPTASEGAPWSPRRSSGLR